MNIIKHKFDSIINIYYNTIEYNEGHTSYGKRYNPYWKYIYNMIGLELDLHYLILCSTNYLITLSTEQYNKFKKYEEELNYKVTLSYIFMKSQGCIIFQHNNKQIYLKSIIEDFNMDNIKYIDEENREIISISNELSKNIYLSNQTNYIVSKLQRKNRKQMYDADMNIKSKYILLKKYTGHFSQIGTSAKVEKNRKWKVCLER